MTAEFFVLQVSRKTADEAGQSFLQFQIRSAEGGDML